MVRHVGEVAAVALSVVTLGVIAITQFSPRATDVVIPDTLGPVSYFMDNCSRCHRAPDDAYTEFKVPRQGDALREMIKRMAQTTAMSASDDQTIQEQYDLHVAIVDKLPYAWIDPESQDLLVGEIIPGTTVTLETDTGPLRAAIKAYRFALPNRPGTIVIERGDQRTTLERPEGP